jgi:hypothetical protein
MRGPISKQRNKHLQTILIEAAKLAPRYHPQLAAVHERELGRGNRNRATLAVARKMVAYLMAVDRSGKPFEIRATEPEGSESATAESKPRAKAGATAPKPKLKAKAKTGSEPTNRITRQRAHYGQVRAWRSDSDSPGVA